MTADRCTKRARRSPQLTAIRRCELAARGARESFGEFGEIAHAAVDAEFTGCVRISGDLPRSNAVTGGFAPYLRVGEEELLFRAELPIRGGVCGAPAVRGKRHDQPAQVGDVLV